MGVMRLFKFLFGAGRGNVVAQTAEVFRVNAEADALRQADLQNAALAQFAAEFRTAGRSPFDRLIDGVNRIPRPAMALGTLALFVSAMVDPIWFAERMVGIQTVPEPLWWLLGAVVSFYFGSRFQAKGQEMQRDVAARLAMMPQITEQLRSLQASRQALPDTGDSDSVASLTLDEIIAPEPMIPTSPGTAPENAALAEWRNSKGLG